MSKLEVEFLEVAKMGKNGDSSILSSVNYMRR